MARTPIIAGNWKMNKGTTREATDLVNELVRLTDGAGDRVKVVVCPPFTVLHAVRQAIGGAKIGMGAQDIFWKASGAYTGQIAPDMLRDAGVSHVIVGHSERRGRFGVAELDFTPDVLRQFGETDVIVNRKVKAALAARLVPILCVGETLTERQNGHTDAVIQTQVERALAGVPAGQIADVVLAYEPVWAIGTGEVCDTNEAERVCKRIRATVTASYNAQVGEAVRVQYGGSMKPDNAAELLAQPNIDGGLVGGASLKASDFAAILQAAQ